MASAVPILCGPRSRGLDGLAQRCPVPREEIVEAGHRCVGDAGEGVLRQDPFSGYLFAFRGRRRCWPLRAGRVGIFSSHEAVIRPVGVLVLEQNDKLAVCRCYITVQYPQQAFFSTNTDLDPAEIIALFVRRWQIEITFAETRAHPGVDTQRQWSDRAIPLLSPTGGTAPLIRLEPRACVDHRGGGHGSCTFA